ncbi:NUMOD4 motif-containing HNH endonuclease [Planctomycetaceae bacterium SH139]
MLVLESHTNDCPQSIPPPKSVACEQWLQVPGYEGLYDVSSHGRLRRASKSNMAPAGYILKPTLDHEGYPRYQLSRRGRYWTVKAHRLVAIAFLGEPPFVGAHVAHYDGNRDNSRLSNLRWATPQENEADKKRHGTVKAANPGERHHFAKLTEELVGRMRSHVAGGQAIKSTARQFGVAYLTAYDAIVGNTWNCVTDPAPVKKSRSN